MCSNYKYVSQVYYVTSAYHVTAEDVEITSCYRVVLRRHVWEHTTIHTCMHTHKDVQVRLKVLTAARIVTLFWDVASCSLINTDVSGELNRLHLQGDKFIIRNIS
jgi:hypothetical protein